MKIVVVCFSVLLLLGCSHQVMADLLGLPILSTPTCDSVEQKVREILQNSLNLTSQELSTEIIAVQQDVQQVLSVYSLNCQISVTQIMTSISATSGSITSPSQNVTVLINECVSELTGLAQVLNGLTCGLATQYVQCTLNKLGLVVLDPTLEVAQQIESDLRTILDNLGLSLCSLDINNILISLRLTSGDVGTSGVSTQTPVSTGQPSDPSSPSMEDVTDTLKECISEATGLLQIVNGLTCGSVTELVQCTLTKLGLVTLNPTLQVVQQVESDLRTILDNLGLNLCSLDINNILISLRLTSGGAGTSGVSTQTPASTVQPSDPNSPSMEVVTDTLNQCISEVTGLSQILSAITCGSATQLVQCTLTRLGLVTLNPTLQVVQQVESDLRTLLDNLGLNLCSLDINNILISLRLTSGGAGTSGVSTQAPASTSQPSDPSSPSTQDITDTLNQCISEVTGLSQILSAITCGSATQLVQCTLTKLGLVTLNPTLQVVQQVESDLRTLLDNLGLNLCSLDINNILISLRLTSGGAGTSGVSTQTPASTAQPSDPSSPSTQDITDTLNQCISEVTGLSQILSAITCGSATQLVQCTLTKLGLVTLNPTLQVVQQVESDLRTLLDNLGLNLCSLDINNILISLRLTSGGAGTSGVSTQAPASTAQPSDPNSPSTQDITDTLNQCISEVTGLSQILSAITCGSATQLVQCTLTKLGLVTLNPTLQVVQQVESDLRTLFDNLGLNLCGLDINNILISLRLTIGGAGTTAAPTDAPTAAPTDAPTAAPTDAPTAAPTDAATAAPTDAPTAAPTDAPTAAPTDAPTAAPTAAPTDAPTAAPTDAPTAAPTDAPTAAPTDAPTAAPTDAPTAAPTEAPQSETSGGCVDPDDPTSCQGRANGDYPVCRDCEKGIYVTCSNGFHYVRPCALGFYDVPGEGRVTRQKVYNPSTNSCERTTPVCPRDLDPFAV